MPSRLALVLALPQSTLCCVAVFMYLLIRLPRLRLMSLRLFFPSDTPFYDESLLGTYGKIMGHTPEKLSFPKDVTISDEVRGYQSPGLVLRLALCCRLSGRLPTLSSLSFLPAGVIVSSCLTTVLSSISGQGPSAQVAVPQGQPSRVWAERNSRHQIASLLQGACACLVSRSL